MSDIYDHLSRNRSARESAIKSGRFDYVKYDEKAQAVQAVCKHLMSNFETALRDVPESREKSLAFTKLEEAYMWMGKAIRDDQIRRNGTAELQEGRENA